MEEVEDPYAALDIDRRASEREIKTRYQQLVKKVASVNTAFPALAFENFLVPS